MKYSSIPLIFLAIAAFWLWAASAAVRRNDISREHARTIQVWLGLLTAWGCASAALALQGAYRSDAFYGLLPGLWVPLAPIAISITLLLAWPAFRQALWTVTERTSARAFFFVHALRIAAVGGIAKAFQGLLPGSFVYSVGLPDLAFGLLSLALGLAYGKTGYGTRLLIGWNVLGLAVLMSAPVLMQLGLPGPVYWLDSQPDARALFEFPMVLAPTLVVTFLFFMNGWHAFVIWRSTHRRVR